MVKSDCWRARMMAPCLSMILARTLTTLTPTVKVGVSWAHAHSEMAKSKGIARMKHWSRLEGMRLHLSELRSLLFEARHSAFQSRFDFLEELLGRKGLRKDLKML